MVSASSAVATAAAGSGEEKNAQLAAKKAHQRQLFTLHQRQIKQLLEEPGR